MSAIKALDLALKQLNQIILSKSEAIKLAMSTLLAGGHLLIEDLPGMGKTTLSNALAKTLGLSYHRIQFTNDLLPGDILGYSLYDQKDNQLKFQPGPVFANIVLADEINRASPRTQSALLEAMEERQVTHEGQTRSLPHPFFVIATQNPAEQSGTHPLPESQLDRFMMRISLGYPSELAEKKLLLGYHTSQSSKLEATKVLNPQKVLSPQNVIALQKLVTQVKCSENIINYVYRILDYSRTSLASSSSLRSHGLSPRAGIALLQAAKAWALLDGRTHVQPDDIQVVFPGIAEHRLNSTNSMARPSVSETILKAVDIF